MKKILSFVLAMAASYCIADGPVIQTSPYMRSVIQATNPVAAQIALGFTGTNINAITLTTISNIAQNAMSPAITVTAGGVTVKSATTAGTGTNAYFLGGIAATNYTTNDFSFYPSVPVVTNLYNLNTNNATRANALAFLSVMNVFNNPIGRGFGQKKVLFLGDSMSDPGYSYYSTALYMDYFLRTTYGNNGNGLNFFDQAGSPSLTRGGQQFFPSDAVAIVKPGDNPPLAMSQANAPVSGAGYTQNTSLIGWPIVGTNAINSEGVWWIQWPGGGTFTVTNYTAGANNVGLILNGYSATTNLVYTNLPPIAACTGNSLQILANTASSNVICGAQMDSTNTPGVESFSYAWSGHGQVDQLSLSATAFQVLSKSISPDWIIFHEKNNDALSDPAYVSNTIALISEFTNSTTKVLLVGTPDMVAGSFAPQRSDLQYAASLMGWYYIDLSQDFNNANLMAANGYFSDGAEHPSAIGAEQWALDLMMRMQKFEYPNANQTNYGIVNLPNTNNTYNAFSGNVQFLWSSGSLSDARDGLTIGGSINAPSDVATANTEKFGFISGLTYAGSYSGGGIAAANGMGLLGYDSQSGFTIGYIGSSGYYCPDFWFLCCSGTEEWEIGGGNWNDLGTHFIDVGGAVNAGSMMATNGFGSAATNVLFFTLGGITNYLHVDVQLFLWHDSDSGTYFTNFNTGMSFKIGNLGAGENFILQPGDAIVSPGNGFTCFTNRAL